MSTPIQPKRTESMDDANQNNELTIESIVNSNIFSSSIASSGGSIAEDQQQQSEELTLFSIVKTFTEDNKKAKKQEKEKKEKKFSMEIKEATAEINISAKKQSTTKPEPSTSSSSKTTPVNAQKRPLSTGQTQTSSQKNRRSSTGKMSVKSETLDTNEDDDDHDDSEEDDEPKPKKKTNRLSVSINDELSNSFKESSSVKRKNSTRDANNESEYDKDTNSLDGTASIRSNNGGGSHENNSINDANTDLDIASEKKSSKNHNNLSIKNLEVNDLVDVKYGSGNQKQVYPAKIMQINLDNNTILVHYNGWNTRYDEWVKIGKKYSSNISKIMLG
jgi:hypothetical protein